MGKYTNEEKKRIKAFMNRLDKVYKNKEHFSSPMVLPEWSELPLKVKLALIPKFESVNRFCDIFDNPPMGQRFIFKPVCIYSVKGDCV